MRRTARSRSAPGVARWGWLALWAGLGGCSHLDVPLTDGLPRRPMSPQAVAFDVISVWVSDEDASEAIWRQIDEQSVPIECRRQLEDAGFRCGMLAGQLPSELERAIGMTGSPVDPTQPHAVATDQESAAQVRHMQLRLGGEHWGTILASGIHEELPLLTTREGATGRELLGRTYRKAQGAFRVTARQLPDGRIGVELTPELEHGEIAMQFTAADGVLRPSPGRPKVTFDELRCSLPMTAGQMLVIGPRADRGGALGPAFLTQEISGRRREKLLVVRLAQTQYDALFEEALPAASEGLEAEAAGDEKSTDEFPSADALSEPLEPVSPTEIEP